MSSILRYATEIRPIRHTFPAGWALAASGAARRPPATTAMNARRVVIGRTASMSRPLRKFLESAPGSQDSQPVIGRVLVRVREGGIVVHAVDEDIDGAPRSDDLRADVHELRRHLSDEVDPEQFLVRWREDEFQHATGVPDDLSARALVKVGTADKMGNVLLAAGIFGPSSERDLRDRVDGQRQDRADALLVGKVERVNHRDARLLHGHGG